MTILIVNISEHHCELVQEKKFDYKHLKTKRKHLTHAVGGIML